MTEVEYLNLEDILLMVRRLDVGPARDIGLLDSAMARPRSSAFGAEVYPTLWLKAAALLESIVRNHALVDGNKRLGWLAATVFIDMNGESVELADPDAFALVIDVAQGEVDLNEIADRLSGAQVDGPT